MDTADFNELQNLNLTKEEYLAFLRLGNDPDFLLWKGVVERFQIKRALNLISGAEMPSDVKDSLDYYRGGHDLWKKALRVVEQADPMIQELENAAETKENK